jgi:hypothetical protein
MKKISLLFGLVISAATAWGQVRTTTQDGPWSDPNTWGGNPAPDFSVATITVNHVVTIDAVDYPVGSQLQVDQLVIGVSGNLTLTAGAALQIVNGGGTDFTNTAGGTFTVESTSEFISNTGVTYSTTGANTIFQPDAIVRAASAAIPTATGYDVIDVFLEGVTGSLTLAASWSQLTSTTDLVVDCPNLGANSINFAGQITSLNTLQINDTDGSTGAVGTAGRVILNSAGTSTISIDAGGLIVQGDSRLWLTSTGTVTVNLIGDFSFAPTSAAFPSIAASTGTGTINFNGGSFLMTAGTWDMASGTNGDGFFNFNNASGMQVTGGTLNQTGAGAGQGTFSFNGNAGDQDFNWVFSSIGTSSTPVFNVVVNNTVGNVNIFDNLTISALTLTNGNLVCSGNLLTVNGAIAVTGGEIDGTIPMALVIGGTGSVAASIPFVSGSALTSFTLNRSGATVNLSNVSFSNGALVTRTAGTFGSAIPALGVYDLTYNNGAALTSGPEIPVSTTVLRNLIKSGNGTLSIASNVTANGSVTINTGSGAVSTGNFNVSIVGDFVVGANFTMNSTATLTFLTRSPSNIHVFNGTAGTVTVGILVINGDVTVTRSLTLLGNMTVQSSSSVTATTGTWTFGGTTAITNNGTGIAFSAVAISNGASLTGPLNGTISMAGNFSGNGTFNANSGTVVFNGTTAYSGSTKTFNNVTVNNGSSFTGAIGWTVTGNVVNNGTINFTTGTLSWDSNGTFSGTSPASLSTLTVFNGRTLNLTLGANLTLLQSLNVNSGTVNHTSTNDFIIGLDLNGGTGTFTSAGRVVFTGVVGADLGGGGAKTFTSIRVTGTLTVAAGTSYAMANTGTIDITGTLNTTAGGASTTTINGSTTVISTGASTTFGNLTIGGTGTLTAAGTLRLNGNFNNSGIFNHGNGTIIFNTTGATTKTIVSSASITFNNLTVENNGNAVDVANNITTGSVNLAGVLNVSISAVFDADGTANNRTFVVLSTADDPANDGSIGPLLSGAQVSGNFTVQRFVSAEAVDRLYRYIASPVVGATVSQLQNSGLPVTGVFTDPSTCIGCIQTSPSMFSYEETREPPYVTNTTTRRAYEAFPIAGQSAASTTMTNGDGYSVYFRQNVTGNLTLAFRGTHPATGANINLPVAPTTTAGDGGYSLVGNPYPSAIRWDNGAGWSKGSISDQIVIRDNATGVHQYFSAASGNGIIAAGQSFWVLSTANGASLQINENAKVSGQTHSFFRSSEPLIDKVDVSLTKNSTSVMDVAVIKVQPGSQPAYESFDAIKFNNKIEDGTTAGIEVHDLAVMSVEASPKALAVNAIPSFTCTQEFNLRLTNLLASGETSANYTFSLNPSGSMKAFIWILKDNVTNEEINLSTNPTYTFTATASSLTNRYKLIISAPSINTSLDVTTITTTVCVGTEAVIKVNNSQSGMTYATEINGVLQPYYEQGNGSKISLFIESDELAQGINTIRVKANSGCAQEFLTSSVQVSKEGLPVATAQPASRCAPGAVTLVASGAPSNGSYAWYAGANSVTVLSSTSQFTTPSLSDTTVYYVAALNAAGCEGERVPVSAFVGDNGAGLQISQAAILCGPSSVELTASSEQPGVTYKWYASPSATESIGAGTTFSTPILSNNTTFYAVSVDVNGCESNRLAYTAEVVTFAPELSVSQSAVVCFNGKADLGVTSSTEALTYKWYSSPSSTTAVAEGSVFATPTLQNTTDYYVEAVSYDGCVSSRKKVSVAVRTADPSIGLSTESQGSICMGDNGFVIASGGDAVDYVWYDGAASELPIYEGVALTTPSLNNSQSFYVAAVAADGCIGSRKKFTVNVTTYELPEIEEISAIELSSKNHTSGLQWYLDGNLLPGETNKTVTATRSGVYGLLVTTQGCESYTDRVFLVTGLEGNLDKQIAIYPNPASEHILIENQGTESVDVAIVDTQGKVLENFELSKGKIRRIEVSEIPKGLYLVKMKGMSGFGTKKIVIK